VNINLKFRDTQISQMSALDGSNARPAYILAMLAERKGGLLKGLGAAAQEAFDSILPPVHKHPARPLHQFETAEMFDPMLAPLTDEEHGAGPVREMALILDYDQTGPARITIN
jgi:hypothetical protein